MIYIDMSGFVPPADWLQKANALTQSLITATDAAARKTIIKDNASVWSELKAHLPFSHKCWFSEAIDVVSDYHIEHFRPKNKIKKSNVAPFDEENRIDWTTNVGYWWLAFNYQNYRIAGSKINSSYKQNYFPLQIGSSIAYNPTDDHNLEQPFLLDPTVQGDPNLLTFEPDGTAKPTIDNNADIRYIRTDISIKIYGLNEIPSLKDGRRTKWSDIYKAVTRANNKYEKIQEAAAHDLADYYALHDEFLDFIENDIKPALRLDREFTAVAHRCLAAFQYEWIAQYVF
jgi:hypothetical protein